MEHAEALETDHFDLLPFVAILMCILGSLLFITLSLVSMSVMHPKIGLDPTGQTKAPILIEWAAGTSFVQENGQREAIRWSPSQWSDLESGRIGESGQGLPDQFRQLLAEATKPSSGKYALFAVRPSGFSTYSLIDTICQRRKIQVGYYPIGEHEDVKLTARASGGGK